MKHSVLQTSYQANPLTVSSTQPTKKPTYGNAPSTQASYPEQDRLKIQPLSLVAHQESHQEKLLEIRTQLATYQLPLDSQQTKTLSRHFLEIKAI